MKEHEKRPVISFRHMQRVLRVTIKLYQISAFEKISNFKEALCTNCKVKQSRWIVEILIQEEFFWGGGWGLLVFMTLFSPPKMIHFSSPFISFSKGLSLI